MAAQSSNLMSKSLLINYVFTNPVLNDAIKVEEDAEPDIKK
jgi:hypothetical protein